MVELSAILPQNSLRKCSTFCMAKIEKRNLVVKSHLTYCEGQFFNREEEKIVAKRTSEAVGTVGGAAAGAALGAKIGAGIGIALGPAGAIAGTVPGAIVGTIIGGLTGNKIGTEIDRED